MLPLVFLKICGAVGIVSGFLCFVEHSDCSGMPSVPIIPSSSPRSPRSSVLDSAVRVRNLQSFSPLDVLRHVASLLHLDLRNSPTYHSSVHEFAVEICSMILKEVRAGLEKASLPQDLWPKLDSSGRFLLFCGFSLTICLGEDIILQWKFCLELFGLARHFCG